MDGLRAHTRGQVPPYSIRCIDLDPAARADGHLHVVAIETSDPDGGETRWSLVQVIEAVRDGERFILPQGDGGQPAELGPTVCPRCAMATLSFDVPDIDVSVMPCS
jgi:hypothetical protein